MIEQFLQSAIDLIASDNGMATILAFVLVLVGILLTLIIDRATHQSDRFYADERAERHAMIEAMIIEARTRGLVIDPIEKRKRTVRLGDDGELVEVEA